jgi:hypothetical protein
VKHEVVVPIVQGEHVKSVILYKPCFVGLPRCETGVVECMHSSLPYVGVRSDQDNNLYWIEVRYVKQ